ADPDKNQELWRTALPGPATPSFTPGRTYYWSVVTNLGPMKLELLDDVAPQHVASLIYLARVGFYDTTVFHRVVEDFMAQGGSTTSYVAEEQYDHSPNYAMYGEYDGAVSHDVRGTLSTANAGEGTDSSGFFVTFVPTTHLDGLHTISGRMVDEQDSKDTLSAIEALAVPDEIGTPTGPIQIISSSIIVEIDN
ncbi:MAG: peptidylprolyl isomerase, partial [Deltaproteobacteria bacterium]|nr:peptidylprolyl isomerase [Deltaproteobacteria bacterium]